MSLKTTKGLFQIFPFYIPSFKKQVSKLCFFFFQLVSAAKAGNRSAKMKWHCSSDKSKQEQNRMEILWRQLYLDFFQFPLDKAKFSGKRGRNIEKFVSSSLTKQSVKVQLCKVRTSIDLHRRAISWTVWYSTCCSLKI